jgi:hypothetical protein
MRSSEAVSRSPGLTSAKGLLLHLAAMGRAADACTRLCSKSRARITPRRTGLAYGRCWNRTGTRARGEGVWNHDLPKPRGREGWQAVHRKELWHA